VTPQLHGSGGPFLIHAVKLGYAAEMTPDCSESVVIAKGTMT
jgi:hypothetical protein